MTYRDPNTLYKVAKRVGAVSGASLRGETLEVSGFVEPAAVRRYNFSSIVLMDGADRFVTGAELTPDGQWSATVRQEDLGNDNRSAQVQAVAVAETNLFAFLLRVEDEVSEAYAGYVRAHLPEDSRDVPTFREELQDLIVQATRVPYVARSIHQSIKTGNNYQTLDLGQTQRVGGRQSRERFLFQIDFRGKSVLDVGANTGENSRIARRLGANLVDGYEYDPFFVEIGRAINAVTGMTRVSLFQGDCTRPELFAGMRYDLVLALSVWVYLEDTMEQVAEITDTMILETHTLDHGMDLYYRSVLPHFPHALALGLTDRPDDPHKSRMLLAFGKDREALERLVTREALVVKPYFQNEFVRSHGRLGGQGILDLADRLLEQHRGGAAYSDDDYRFGATTYFEVFLAGMAQYRRYERRVDAENLFVGFLQRGIRAGRIDDGLTAFVENPSWMFRKVENKYEDALHIIEGNTNLVPPVEVVPASDGSLAFTTTTGEEIRCDVFDGHHRYFMCELLGVETLPFLRNVAGDDLIARQYAEQIAANYTLEIA